jgi:hypothetical protein
MQRLRHLERKGSCDSFRRGGRGTVQLTEAGRDLEPVIGHRRVGDRWLFAEPLPSEVSPVT